MANKKKLTFEQIRAYLQEEKRKYDEEQEFKETVKRVYSRPKVNYNKLSASMKKSAHLNSGGLDLHKDENRHYSKENTQRYLEGSSYFDTYSAMKEQDSWD
jgi:hypothetical protein